MKSLRGRGKLKDCPPPSSLCQRGDHIGQILMLASIRKTEKVPTFWTDTHGTKNHETTVMMHSLQSL